MTRGLKYRRGWPADGSRPKCESGKVGFPFLAWNASKLTKHPDRPHTSNIIMANNKSYLFAALALLLTGEKLAKADVYVCGTDYADAETNCIVNTACPNGDGCSTDQTCFALPDESCLQPPMLALNMTDLYVCGIDLEDALTNCRSEDDYCTDVTDITAYCKSSGEDVTRSCFIIPYAECPATTEPTTTSSPSISVSPTMSALPTTPPLLFVCGTDYADAASNFCSLTPCPTGDVS